MAKYTTTQTVEIACPVCDSDHVVKIGKRNGHQRYLCRGCAKKFTTSGNTPGRRFPPEQTGQAIKMFYSGMSYKQIAESMAETFDIPEPSKATLYEWVRDYTDRALREMGNHKVHTGPEWVVDEMVVKVGGQNYWNWNVMDSKTRFILASHLTKGRTARDARAVLRKARENAANLPKRIKTDRLKSYISAAEDVTGADAKHIQSDGLRAEVNNNLSERLQGTFRSRAKTLRGLDGKASGQRYLDGWVLTYNLFREHESLGNRTPAEAAKLKAPFDSWEGVVEQSAPTRRAVPRVVEVASVKRHEVEGMRVEVKPLEALPERVKATRVKQPPVAKPAKPRKNGNAAVKRRTRVHHPFLRRSERRR